MPDAVVALALSPDGKRLAVAVGDSITVWRATIDSVRHARLALATPNPCGPGRPIKLRRWRAPRRRRPLSESRPPLHTDGCCCGARPRSRFPPHGPRWTASCATSARGCCCCSAGARAAEAEWRFSGFPGDAAVKRDRGVRASAAGTGRVALDGHVQVFQGALQFRCVGLVRARHDCRNVSHGQSAIALMDFPSHEVPVVQSCTDLSCRPRRGQPPQPSGSRCGAQKRDAPRLLSPQGWAQTDSARSRATAPPPQKMAFPVPRAATKASAPLLKVLKRPTLATSAASAASTYDPKSPPRCVVTQQCVCPPLVPRFPRG
jgi:hypothetical protein